MGRIKIILILILFKLKFVGGFIKAKRCTATRLHTPGPCKDTFTHMTPYRTPRPLQQPVHIMHCPLSDTLDLELSLSIISNRRTSIFIEEVSTNIHCICNGSHFVHKHPPTATGIAYKSAIDMCQKAFLHTRNITCYTKYLHPVKKGLFYSLKTN